MSPDTAVLVEAFGAVFGALALWVLIGWALVAVVRHRRIPDELHGDWWTAFERQFRAYAHAVSQAADGPWAGRDPPPSGAAP